MQQPKKEPMTPGLGVQEKSKVIGKSEYRVRQLLTSPSKMLFEKLARIGFPSIARSNDAAMAVDKFFDLLSEEESDSIQETLLSTVTVKPAGQQVWVKIEDIYEIQFAGHLADLYELLGFALEVNYNDFWQKVSGAMGSALLTKVKSEFLSRMGSPPTGSTGDSSSDASPASPS